MVKQKQIIYFVYTLIILSSFLSGHLVNFRYIKYSSIPIFIFLFLNYKTYELNLKSIFIPFIILGFSFIISVFDYSFQGLLEIIFIFSSFSLLLLFKNVDYDLRYFSIISMLLFLIFNISFFNLSEIIGVLQGSPDNLQAEGAISYIFGFLIIYFLLEKKYYWFIINLIFLLLSVKRGVVLGILIIFILNILPIKVQRIIFKKYIFILLNIIFLFFTYLLFLGTFNEIIAQYTGISIGHFTGGRTTILQYFIPYILENLNKVSLIGLGQGNAYMVMTNTLNAPWMLHNDVLKIITEHGVIIFIMFFYFLYNTTNKKLFLYAIFLNVLFFSGNMLIYSGPLSIYFLVCYKFNIESFRLNKKK